MKDVSSPNPILERIFIATNATNDSELSTKLSLTRQSVSKGRTTGDIPSSWVLKVAKEYNVSSDWLFFGTGSMLAHRQEDDSPFIPHDRLDPSILDEIVMIPMVEARLSAGGGSLETSSGVEKEYSFRRDFIERKGNPKNMVLMRVSGDSMTPEIMDNDVVLIDQSKTNIQQGRMFAVGFEECIYLKRIDLLPKQIILTSTNEKYAPVIIDLNDDSENLFRVIGKVLWCAREYL